jgi:hypothetical protein
LLSKKEVEIMTKQEAYAKGERDGAHNKGYHNPASDLATKMVWSGAKIKEISEA